MFSRLTLENRSNNKNIKQSHSLEINHNSSHLIKTLEILRARTQVHRLQYARMIVFVRAIERERERERERETTNNTTITQVPFFIFTEGVTQLVVLQHIVIFSQICVPRKFKLLLCPTENLPQANILQLCLML